MFGSTLTEKVGLPEVNFELKGDQSNRADRGERGLRFRSTVLLIANCSTKKWLLKTLRLGPKGAVCQHSDIDTSPCSFFATFFSLLRSTEAGEFKGQGYQATDDKRGRRPARISCLPEVASR